MVGHIEGIKRSHAITTKTRGNERGKRPLKAVHYDITTIQEGAMYRLQQLLSFQLSNLLFSLLLR